MKLKVLTFLLAFGSAHSQTCNGQTCASKTGTNSNSCKSVSDCFVLAKTGSCKWTQTGKKCEFVPPVATSPPATSPPATSPPATSPPATSPPATSPGNGNGNTKTSPPAASPPAAISVATCQMRLVKTQIQLSRAYDYVYEEIQPCANDVYCEMWESVPGADAANLTTFSGTCEVPDTTCATTTNGNGNGNGNNPATTGGNGNSAGTTGTDRITICHRTCSSKNPWVRITIDTDAWNATQCEGHNNHEVLFKVSDGSPAECSTKITKLAQDEGSSAVAIRNKYWGPNDRDYAIKYHGNKQAKDFPSKTAEKEYWREWEPACPYVNSDKCCDWKTGNCCGGIDGSTPPPASVTPTKVSQAIAVIKYACSKNVNSCSESVVTAALSTGECQIDIYTGYSGDAAKYCYKVTNKGGSTLCDMQMTDDTAVVTGNPNGVIPETTGAMGCMTAGETKMWPGLLNSKIPEPGVTEKGRVVVTAKPQGSPASEPYIWADDYAGLQGVVASIKIKKYACSITTGTAANYNCQLRIGSSACVDEIMYGPMGTPAVYCYKVTNPSAVTLCEVTVADADGMNGGVTSPGMPQGCMSGGVDVYPQAFSLPTITEEEYKDAVVTGYPYSDDGLTKLIQQPLTDKDPAGVEPSMPAITIKKYACAVTSGNAATFNCELGMASCVDDILYAPSGTPAVYCFKVTNPSDTTLCKVSMVDNDGFTSVVTGSSPMPAGCMLPGDSVFTAVNPVPTIQLKEVGNATVTGTPYSDDGLTPTGGGPVTDKDPAGVDPSSPQIAITKYACSDSIGAGNSFNCAAGVADKSCVLEMLRVPRDSPAVYCFQVSNPSDTTLCKVLVTDMNDGFSAVPTGTSPMPSGCMKPGDKVFTTPKPLIVTAYENVPATVVGTPYNDEGTSPTGGLPVTATDPAGVDPAGKTPMIDIIKYACSDPSGLGSTYNCKDNIPTAACFDEMLFAPLGTNAVYCFEVTNPSHDTTVCEVAMQDDTVKVGVGSSGMPANCLKPLDTVYPQAHPLSQIMAYENYPANVTGVQYNDAGTVATGCTVSADDLAGVDPAAQNPIIQIKKYACSDPSNAGINYNCKDNIPTDACVDEILYAPSASLAVYCFEVSNPSDTTTLCQVAMKDGMLEVGTGRPDMPGNCLKPKDIVYPPAHPLPQVTVYENYNATVKGTQYNDAGTVVTGGEVTDYDPAGVDPAGKTPVIGIKKYACSDLANEGSNYDCKANIPTDACVDDILSLPMSNNAVYCFEVINPSFDTTLCEVVMTDGTSFEVGAGSLNMPANCLNPQSIVYPEAHPVPLVAVFESYNATVTGVQYNNAGTLATGSQVSASDPAGVDPIQPTCPTDMGLTGSRANQELGESCSNKAVYLENMIPPSIDLGTIQLADLEDLFYTIESTGNGRVSFRVQNPFNSNHDMYVRYHKPVGGGHAMEKGCMLEPDVTDCAFLDEPIEAYCIDPFFINGNDQVKPYTIVDVYLVTIGQNSPSATEAQVDNCCLDGQAQPALTEDVIHFTFILDCYCPTLYNASVGRSLLRGGERRNF